MHVTAQREHFSIRRLVGFGSIACLAVSLLGWATADILGDDTEPFAETAVTTLAWDVFLMFGAMTLLLGVTYALMLIWRATRRG